MPFRILGQSQTVRQGAHARHPRVFCHVPRRSQRSGVRASVMRQPAVHWRSQLARRTTVLHRRREAFHRCSALPYRRPIANSAVRRAREASSRVLPRPEMKPAQRRSCVGHTTGGCVLEVTARTSHHGLAPKKREASRRCSAIPQRTNRSQPARHDEHARQAHVFCHITRDRQRSSSRASVMQKPAAFWRSQLARRTTILHQRRQVSCRCSAFPYSKPTITSAARCARAATSRVLLRPETRPAQRRPRVSHAKAGCVLEFTARTSHHGLAPKERGLPPMQPPL